MAFLNIMKNVKVAKPSSPTDNAGISASSLSICKESHETPQSTAVSTVLTAESFGSTLNSDRGLIASSEVGGDISVERQGSHQAPKPEGRYSSRRLPPHEWY